MKKKTIELQKCQDIWELLDNFLKTGIHACTVQVDLKNYLTTFTSENHYLL